MKLNRKISLLTGFFTSAIILIITLVLLMQWLTTLRNQQELESRDMAVTVSRMSTIRENIIKPNGSIPIQREMETLRLNTRVQYIQVINIEGYFFSHSSPSQLGRPVEDPFLLAFLRQEYPETEIRKPHSFADPMVEGIAPVFSGGEFSGIVVCGFLNGRIIQEIYTHLQSFVLIIILAVFTGLYAAGFLASSIKKSMYNLEPEEIARLLGEKQMILENLKAAIVTIDQFGKIIYFNRASGDLLGLHKIDLNRHCGMYFFDDPFQKCLDNRVTMISELKTPAGRVLQCRMEPMTVDSRILGVTGMMEDLSEVRARAEELTGIKQLNEGLRSQNHEFMNKLHTISGLIQLEEYGEALQFISRVSTTRQQMIGKLNCCIKNPSVAGLILGKYNKAQEMKIEFTLDDSSYISDTPGISDTVNLILGNLLENALEELAGRSGGEIKILLKEGRGSIEIAVEDNGDGIPDGEKVFLRGVSSKGSDRGLGLYLIREKIDELNGKMTLSSVPGATVFHITLPVGEEESI